LTACEFEEARVRPRVGAGSKDRRRHILTTDRNEFGVYRFKGGKRFEAVKWFD
jgi:hypothetical protein